MIPFRTYVMDRLARAGLPLTGPRLPCALCGFKYRQWQRELVCLPCRDEILEGARIGTMLAMIDRSLRTRGLTIEPGNPGEGEPIISIWPPGMGAGY